MRVVCIDFYGNEHHISSSCLTDRLSVYGVFIDEGKILLIQDPRSLRWELPGGGLEPGETTEKALTREFIEETGVSPHGPFELLGEWEELFYDLPSSQAWRSKRKFYSVKGIENKDKILQSGNGDDSAVATFMALADVDAINVQPSIKKVIMQAVYKIEGK